MTRVDAIAEALADALTIVDLNADWQAIARPLAYAALGALAEHDRGERAHAGARAIASLNTGNSGGSTVVWRGPVQPSAPNAEIATVEPPASAPVTTAEGGGSSPSATESPGTSEPAPAETEAEGADAHASSDGSAALPPPVTPRKAIGRPRTRPDDPKHRFPGRKVGLSGYQAGCRCWGCREGKKAEGRIRRAGQEPTPVVPARERPEKPVVLPAPPPPEEEPVAAEMHECQHCSRPFESISALTTHETTCGRTGSPVAPPPTDDLVLACGSCDWTLAADVARAEALLAKHCRAEHGRFPSADEQRKRVAS